MAKKKLNRKVAVVGIAILCVIIAAGGYVLYMKYGQSTATLLAKASEAVNDKDYKSAESYYGRAYGKTKEQDKKIEILFQLAKFHLINDGKVHEPEWAKARNCWATIVNIDPKNIEAKRKLNDFFYESADSGNSRAWNFVETNASELIKLYEEKQLPADPFILMVKARATLELVRTGQKTDTERPALISEAITEFENLLKLTPEDITIYQYLADATVVKGSIESEKGGSIDARDKAIAEAEKILQKAVEVAPDNPRAWAYLLNTRLAAADSPEKKAALEKEISRMVGKFGSSADAYAVQTRYFQMTNNLDKAIESITKATNLEPDNIEHIVTACNMYYRKATVENDRQFFDKAVQTASAALNLPVAQNIPGPKQASHINNRFLLLTLLSTYYMESAYDAQDSGDSEQNKRWAALAKDSIGQIEQLLVSTEDLNVIKWQGMLALAEGNTPKAVRQMYRAYEQIKATGQYDALLCYSLARAFRNSQDSGAYQQFLEDALFRSRVSFASGRPVVLLDYADILLWRKDWSGAISIIDSYEKARPITERTNTLRAKAHIGAGRFDEAEKLLAKMDANSATRTGLKLSLVQSRIMRILQLQAQQKPSGSASADTDAKQLAQYRKEQAELVGKMLSSSQANLPVSSLLAVCQDLTADGKIDQAKNLADEFLKKSPDNLSMKIYRQLLNEPDIKGITPDRRNKITEDVLSEISDEYERSIALGQYYLSRRLTEKEMSELKGQTSDSRDFSEAITKAQKDVKANAAAEFKKAHKLKPDDATATTGLFDAALQSGDMAIAEEMSQTARKLNLDQCDGGFFAARLDAAKGNYTTVLSKLDECLKFRPLFSFAYLLKSQINNTLKQYEDAITNAKTAATMNPFNGEIVKHYAMLCYQRNQRLARSITVEQRTETERAIISAMILNPDEWQLQSIYAEIISDQDPEKAMVLLQQIKDRYPNLSTTMMLGNMAMKMALKEQDKDRKEFLINAAGAAIEDAYRMAPDNSEVLNSYMEYMRISGQQDKAMATFKSNQQALWQFYLKDGQIEKAKQVLESLYAKNPQDTKVLGGLAAIAEKNMDREGLMKYTEELVAVDKSTVNELMQIQMYLEAGLGDQAAKKLASFRERYPDEPGAMLLEAWAAMAGGDVETALSLVNRNLGIDDKNPTAWRLRGQINRLRGDLNQAAEDMQKSKNIDPNPAIRTELAKVYIRMGRTAEAIGELKAAIQDEQGPLQARTVLEGLYIQTGRKNELKEFYYETIQKYPDSDYWLYRIGRYALDENRFAEAEQLLEKSWQLSLKQSGQLAALDYYLETLFKSGQYQKLLNYAAGYIDTPYSPIAYAQMAQTQIKMGNKASGTEYFQKAIEKSGTNNNLILSILENMSKSLTRPEAVKWVETRLKAEPDSVQLNFIMFNIALQNQEYNKAAEHIDRCISQTGTDKPSWAEYMMQKGNVLMMAYSKTSDRKYLLEAITQFRKILATQPGNLTVMNNLAYLLADNNQDLQQALEYAEKAYNMAPGDASRADTYAYVLCKSGDYKKAQELGQKAVQLYEVLGQPIPWDLYMHLGMASEGLERKTDAVSFYKLAIDRAGKSISDTARQKLTEALDRVSK